MCYRLSQSFTNRDIAHFFDLPELEATALLTPRYNLGITQPILAVRHNPDLGRREATFLNFGLIPEWAQDINIGAKLANARSETVLEKPSFKQAFRRRRCIIPASGFFEWEKRPDGKQPHYFSNAKGNLLPMAGIWEHWQSPDGSEIESCAILTTKANELVGSIHDRMPVILEKRHIEWWLTAFETEAHKLTPLLAPYAATAMQSWTVSRAVNAVRNEGPDLIEPEKPKDAGQGTFDF